MDYDCLADYLFYFNSVGQKSKPRSAGVPEQRRHISGMARMWTALLIIVTSGIRQRFIFRAGAAFAFVNVKGEHPAAAFAVTHRQAVYIRRYNDTLTELIEIDLAMYFRIIGTTLNFCFCKRKTIFSYESYRTCIK